jgi:hypothetical protein
LNNQRSSLPSNRYLRLCLVVAGILLSLFAIQASARYGLSHLLTTYALTSGNVAAAKKAIQFSPKDAEAHFAGAAVLTLSGAPDQALAELERAVSLKPTDFGLWCELGLLRDQLGDAVGALAAFNEAVRRAPFYSQPHWDRGNVLLRKGDYEAAFADLNQAAQSNPELIPSLIDLAWSVSRGDVKLTEQLAKIEGDKMRIAFVRFLARRGKPQDALIQFDEAGTVSEAVRKELVEQLLSRGAFKEAFDIWKASERAASSREATAPGIYDGGFEGSLAFDQGGFAWRVPRDLQATTVSLDSGQPQSGSKNLRVEFNGSSNPGSSVLSQLILVGPSQHYRINFAARSQDVVSGGLPFLTVSDAAGSREALGRSRSLPSGTADWQFFSVEFDTTPTTTAVVLSLQRENCTTSPCPIFGSISLDSFSLEQSH